MGKNKLTVVNGSRTSVRGYAEPPAPGNWMTVNGGSRQHRDRKALSYMDQLVPGSGDMLGTTWAASGRQLSAEQLWKIYLRTPEIRAAVDSIVRRIATWDWTVAPDLLPPDSRYEAAVEASEAVITFLNRPTVDGWTFQEWATAVCTDLMVFDAGAAEMVQFPDGQLQEMPAFRGADFLPVTDDHSQLLGYKQCLWGVVTNSDQAPMFELDQLLYMRLFANTTSPLGLPLIDTLVNEAVAMLVASEHIMLALDADEIPPGILVLGGLADAAISRAKADLKNVRGGDHKLRILNSPTGGEVTADWVELQRSLKDVAMVEVVEQIRRTIWRTFGVSPVEMGSEDSNRAHAGIQLDVADSHLITPILELIQAKFQSFVVPLVLEATEWEPLTPFVKFMFDQDQRLTAEDQRYQAESYRILEQTGTLSINEVRQQMGFLPIPGGDIHRIEVGGAGLLIPVAKLGDETVSTFSVNEPGGSEDAVPQPSTEVPDEQSRPMLVHRAPDLDDLPSEWEITGTRFESVRDAIMDLPALAQEVSGYARAVDPIWLELQTEIEAAFASEYAPGKLTADRASRLSRRVGQALSKAENAWEMASEPFYSRSAKVGLDFARNLAGLPVLENWEVRAEVYRQSAMGYLKEQNSPIGTVRQRLAVLIAGLTVEGGGQVQQSLLAEQRGTDRVPDVDPETPISKVLLAVAAAVASQLHRVKNWAGRLVELANEVVFQGLSEAPPLDPVTGNREEDWVVEWVHVGDNRMCSTCSWEGQQGFRLRSQLTVLPGGQTECRARCRCVLVWHRPASVRDGSAKLIGS